MDVARLGDGREICRRRWGRAVQEGRGGQGGQEMGTGSQGSGDRELQPHEGLAGEGGTVPAVRHGAYLP